MTLSVDQRGGIRSEVRFRTMRSRGPGGQHVNKVETRVELTFDVGASLHLSEVQKQQLRERLPGVARDGLIWLRVDASRSQHRNKEIAIQRLLTLLEKELKPRKKRTRTRPTPSSREERLQAKKRRSRTKQLRRIPPE